MKNLLLITSLLISSYTFSQDSSFNELKLSDEQITYFDVISKNFSIDVSNYTVLTKRDSEYVTSLFNLSNSTTYGLEKTQGYDNHVIHEPCVINEKGVTLNKFILFREYTYNNGMTKSYCITIF